MKCYNKTLIRSILKIKFLFYESFFGNCLIRLIVPGTLLIFRLEAGQLGLSITGGQVLFNNTRGLLGTYDGDVKNEYTLRNGSVLPVTSSPQTIYKVFGDSCKTD